MEQRTSSIRYETERGQEVGRKVGITSSEFWKHLPLRILIRNIGPHVTS